MIFTRGVKPKFDKVHTFRTRKAKKGLWKKTHIVKKKAIQYHRTTDRQPVYPNRIADNKNLLARETSVKKKTQFFTTKIPHDKSNPDFLHQLTLFRFFYTKIDAIPDLISKNPFFIIEIFIRVLWPTHYSTCALPGVDKSRFKGRRPTWILITSRALWIYSCTKW